MPHATPRADPGAAPREKIKREVEESFKYQVDAAEEVRARDLFYALWIPDLLCVLPFPHCSSTDADGDAA